MSVRRRNVRERVERERKRRIRNELMDKAMTKLCSPEGLAGVVRDAQLYTILAKLRAHGVQIDG